MSAGVVIDYRAPLCDFLFQKGDAQPLSVIWTDDAGNPVNLTGYSAVLTVQDGGPPLLTLTSPAGLVLGGANGTITSTPFAQTATWAQGSYTLVVTDGGGKPTTLLKGQIGIES